jgi:thioredoxin reductase (NADPH)
MKVYDAAIVGAGPIGLELAVAFKRAGLHYVHFDARQIGHTMTWWSPGTRFFSSNERIAIAGVPLITPDGNKSTREQYLAYLRGVVEQFKLEIKTFEPVVSLVKTTATGDRPHGVWRLQTERREQEPGIYHSRSVILATGGTERARRLNIPGEDLPHVSHYFNEPHLYFGQRLLIVGGRNSAAEAALRCHHAGAKVSLSYRQTTLPQKSIKYWLLPELQGLIDSGRIKAYYGTTPTGIRPGKVELKFSDGIVREIPADFVLLLVGYEADMTLFRMAGAALHAGTEAPVFDEHTMETTVPGLYVAGTAVAGTQERYEVFIENSHVHVDRIVQALVGTSRRGEVFPAVNYEMPES